jgi:uncharacterized protein YbaR (Trm112 family)
MTLEPRLIDIMVCPVDKGPLYVVNDGDETFLYNERLRRRYRVVGDIPNLLPDEADQVSDSDHDQIMETIAASGAPLTGGGAPA